jgi:hypothetical protein
MRTALFIAVIVLMVASITLGINRNGADADQHVPEPPPVEAAIIPPLVIEQTTTTTTAPPTTVAPTIPEPSKHPLTSKPEIEEIIRYWFAEFGQTVADQAVAVSWCETGGTLDPTKVNASGHTGLFQISPQWHRARAERLGFTWDQLTDPAVNTIVAVDIYRETNSWGEWTCRFAA